MNLATFLAHAVRLESEAECIYRQSAEALDPAQYADAVAFFGEMAGYARQHLEETMSRAGMNDLTSLPAAGYVWDGAAAPESVELPSTGDAVLDLDRAMSLALAAERRAAAFYAQVADAAGEPAVTALAETFAAEERAHVLALERFMGDKPY